MMHSLEMMSLEDILDVLRRKCKSIDIGCHPDIWKITFCEKDGATTSYFECSTSYLLKDWLRVKLDDLITQERGTLEPLKLTSEELQEALLRQQSYE